MVQTITLNTTRVFILLSCLVGDLELLFCSPKNFNSMSELTQTKISNTENNSLILTVTSVNPDATVSYFKNNGTDQLQTTALYMLIDLLERTGKQNSELYKKLQSEVTLVCASNPGSYNGGAITEITGSWFLESVGEKLMNQVSIEETNYNNNWDEGVFDNVSSTDLLNEPHFSKLPSIKIKMVFKEAMDLYSLNGLIITTPLDTSLVEWI